MIFLTVDEVISIHNKLIIKTGGSYGLRDRGLLESAVFSVYSEFYDVEQYPSIEEKSARFAFSIINNHAFIDGNKRIGILVMLMTLKINGIIIFYLQEDLIKLGLSIADGSYQYQDILNWIYFHKNR